MGTGELIEGDLSSLRDGLLYLFVFGPGFGESVVLRIPPATWIVVDGCRAGRSSPPANLLRIHGGRWSCVVLTHPHLDHAHGLDEVLAGPGEGPIGCVPPTTFDDAWTCSPDPEARVRAGTLEHLLARIEDLWRASPERRWELRRGERREVGGAQFRVLHPTSRDLKRWAGRANMLASPMIVEWRSLRLLLGSDLLKRGWKDVALCWPDLKRHDALKVPHHGSLGAQHGVLLGTGKADDRLWVVTPFNRGRTLPRFEDGEGMERLLKHVRTVHLTGLPVPLREQSPRPMRLTRQELARKRTVAMQTLPGGVALEPVQAPESGLDCYVAAGFAEDGSLVEVRHGPGAVVVEEEDRPRVSGGRRSTRER